MARQLVPMFLPAGPVLNPDLFESKPPDPDRMFHGAMIYAETECQIDHVSVQGVYGSGFLLRAARGDLPSEPAEDGTAGGGANANRTQFDQCRANGNYGHGIVVSGGDSNICLTTAFNAVGNYGIGCFDASFLGCTWLGCHASAQVMEPYVGRDGGTCFSVWLGCYAEAGQLPSRIVRPGVVIGGDHGAGFLGNGARHALDPTYQHSDPGLLIETGQRVSKMTFVSGLSGAGIEREIGDTAPDGTQIDRLSRQLAHEPRALLPLRATETVARSYDLAALEGEHVDLLRGSGGRGLARYVTVTIDHVKDVPNPYNTLEPIAVLGSWRAQPVECHLLLRAFDGDADERRRLTLCCDQPIDTLMRIDVPAQNSAAGRFSIGTSGIPLDGTEKGYLDLYFAQIWDPNAERMAHTCLNSPAFGPAYYLWGGSDALPGRFHVPNFLGVGSTSLTWRRFGWTWKMPVEVEVPERHLRPQPQLQGEWRPGSILWDLSGDCWFFYPTRDGALALGEVERNHRYAIGECRIAPNGQAYVVRYVKNQPLQRGVTAASEPTWGDGQILDGDVVWKPIGRYRGELHSPAWASFGRRHITGWKPGAWTLPSGGAAVTTVPVHGEVDAHVTIAGVQPTDAIVVTPNGAPPPGLCFSAWCSTMDPDDTAGRLTLRAHNYTALPILIPTGLKFTLDCYRH